ncbi:snaclec mucrocetin subunit beta-like [Patiria miniata]|uniref:C-type lectin domain-containing protein n=1 Tax=Patiria miniata TaxID=46514 RepID=A0A913Z994_PATMI|nr:snaclec mucrocetin subunit beta-like [Patiria miniata]
MILTFLLLSGFILHASSQFACPAGWTKHAEFCYLMITTTKLTWSEADGRCRAAGGELALPVTREEIRFLWTMFRAQNLSESELQPSGGIWLGCRRTAARLWGCSNTPTLDFAWWLGGQPDGGDCVVMWHHGPRWSDAECETARFAACQRRGRVGRCHQRGGLGHQIHGCLLNHVLREVQVRDPAMCCIKCVDDPRCHSFNLVESTCQLNTAQRSDVNFNGETATNDTCVYYEID